MSEYLKYLILAIIQGISEILPISSSAHLLLASQALELPSDLTLSIFLHLSSALAVIIFFRKRLWQLIKGFFLFLRKKGGKEEFREVIMLLVASVPAAIAGILLEDFIEEKLTATYFIGFFLCITGLLLIFTARRQKVERKLSDLKYRNAFYIGCFQMIGILPGISRSGITYTGTRINKLNSNEASEFIFFMFIPVSLGSALIQIIKLISSHDYSSISFGPLALASVVVLVLTYFCLILFLKIIKKDKMHYFSYYLIPLGLTLMIMNLYK